MSRRRSGLSARSGREWGVRIVLALVLAFCGLVSVKRTLATVLRDANPLMAYALAPTDGRVLGAVAQSLSSAGATDADRQRANRLAIQALRSDPTALSASIVLGLNFQLRGEISRGEQLLEYSEKLSRRELRAQIWAIENAVARNDIASALRHYDIALRTSRQAPELLFPVLGSAIDDPDVRLQLVKVMAVKPPWNQLFIPYVAGNGPDPAAVAMLFYQLATASVEIPPPSQAMAVARLLPSQPGKAWEYYASIRPGATRMRSRDRHFDADIAAPTLFDWVPSDDAGFNVVIQRQAGGGFVEVSVPFGKSGNLIQQFQYLKPGVYSLRGKSSEIDKSSENLFFWQLSCEGGQEIGRVNVPGSVENSGWFVGRLIVPRLCPVQILSLVAKQSDHSNGITGRFNAIELQPLAETP